MKQVGCVLLVVVVAVAGFLGVAAWSILRAEDQSALTSEVEATVADASQRPADRRSTAEHDYDVAYTYRVDGVTYRDEARLSDLEWEPGQALTVCVDPEEPASHVVKVDADPCGSESVNFGRISTATPSPR